MKLQLIFTFLATITNCWYIDLLATNSRTLFANGRIFQLSVKSDAGGRVSTICSTNSNNSLRCENSNIKTSSQGGYYVKDMKCEDVFCRLSIISGESIWEVEVACIDGIDLSAQLIFGEIETLSCKIRRQFSVYMDGGIEYQD
ncbi:hypothetical protein CONCODRAFT_4354 [Conidiobolus coronatus NRRL 28638]|uniref:Cyanovirin-N domain-containing protein n=1 Tax=Conidiobolus coronatus (strain ATCC 28846 / CBS 209.66 / NRRL 28638) TaxID=796925 RepID=A0A137PCM1_CONC2|nr:hypothetical protein CONCODRAFT_4354 [Conidiobolus coronatus NRRL 28638]|eukprot:KXN72749.1 hypothetical protein CONCODRAFT_4354 [Conidiobolus coronatus NRRL 28638]